MEPHQRASSNSNNSNRHASMDTLIDHINPKRDNSWITFSLLLRSRVYIHLRTGIVLLLAICIGAILVITSPTTSPVAVRDYESVFTSITDRRVPLKWRGYLGHKTSASPSHPKLYYPRQCPTNNRSCAKLVPSFVFAGSERSGTTYIFNTLQTHPQVIGTVDHQNSGTLFDSDDEALFETYLSQFPTLEDEIPLEEVVVAGEHAPQYLYRSHIAARRLRELLPHVKLVFILRDPIDRAHSHYFTGQGNRHAEKAYELNRLTKTGTDADGASFETAMETELDILRQCGHTTTRWEEFVRCHESNEIRVARDPPFNAGNCTEECDTVASDDRSELDTLARGMYYTALLPFLDEFPASQIFVKRTEDFLSNPSASFQMLARFLGIDPTYFSERNFYKHYGLSESILFGNDAAPPPPLYYHPRGNHRHHDGRVSALALQDGFGDSDDTIDYDNLPAFVKSPSDVPILDLGTRYRLQKVFRNMNQRLLDLFERGKDDFVGWDYDVERG